MEWTRKISAWVEVLCLLALYAQLPASGDVVINEVQISNGCTLLDEDGDYSDWIELLNRGTQTVSLAGWGLSDRADNPTKWLFPPWSLAPGARQLVFASGKDRTNVLEAAVISSPQEVPGMVLWLRADAEAYTNGAKVTGWTDLSGCGNHAFTTNGMACPSFRTNAVNGHASIRFAKSSGQEVLLPVTNFNGLASLRDVTVFIVCRWSGQVTSGMLGAWDAVTGNTHFEVQSGGLLRLRVAALDTSVTTAMTANAWCQVAASVNSAGDTPVARLYRDGVLRGSLAKDPGAAALSSYTYMALGNSLKSERFFDGDMSEVIFFNRALSTSEREAVERCLALRYALPGAPHVTELHTNFSLDADGETVFLTGPGTNNVDCVDVPDVPMDASYGRSPDGAGTFAYLAAPTPGAVNVTNAYEAPLSKPKFSRERGMCDAPFELSLSHTDAAASIYYTLDGSEPALTNGTRYSAPISIAATTVVRAMAFKTNALPHRAIATHTYLFLNGVLGQTSRPNGYPADWAGFSNTSYAVSAYVAGQSDYTNAMLVALRSVPVLSLALSKDDMFGTNGVYANPEVDGFERVVSAEWITNGTGQVQLDAALRVEGGASRVLSNTPKKSLRLLFRSDYGADRLKTPVLSSGGTVLADFNTLILRAEYNNAWIHLDGTQRLRGSNVRDQWVRDTQFAMDGVGSHGNHVQLFINGIYWGLYNVSERPDAAFAANYFGGGREDYDAITSDGIRDGDNVAWNALLALAKAGLSTPAQYEAIQQYLDLDNLIDYMIINIYSGNMDWPQHNWTAVRRRETGAGYRFICWDSERTLEGTNDNCTAATFTTGPAYLYTVLRTNAEFRLHFADRLHRHLFNGGALTPAVAAACYTARSAMVEAAVFGEAARWGAYRKEVTPGGSVPRYGTNDWVIERSRILNAYFPVRTGIVLAQFRAANLYPTVSAPEFSQPGGALESGAKLAVVSTQGVAYVTFDGSDPRVAYTGAVASNAVAYTGPFAVTNAGVIKARALTNGVWSALTEAAFGVVVSETVFLPIGDGDWGVASNWFGTVVPQGAGNRVRIGTPAADRNVNLRAPVIVGQITFDHAGNTFRNRVRDRSTGNTLTFDGGTNAARISVTGSGVGYAEFDVVAGVVMASTVELNIQHLEGDPDYGALRLRDNWSGSGGLRKTGAGVASLTGETKSFTGSVDVRQGVLSVTGPAAPALATGVSVAPGGQLRLTSASAPDEPRVYAFGGTLALSGLGRGAEIPDAAGQGKLGALRYAPDGDGSEAVLTSPVLLQGVADIHVEGGSNRLELAGGVSGGSQLVKSGGGLLLLNGGTALTAAVQVAAGTLAFGGAAAVGPVTGAGTVRLDGNTIAALSAEGVTLEAVLEAGTNVAQNGVLRLPTAPASLRRIRIYLPLAESCCRGVLFVPLAADLASLVRGTAVEVYSPDAAGTNEYGGAQWSLRTDAQVVAAPAAVNFGGSPMRGRVVEVRLGASPASFGAWRAASFTNEADRVNASVSGPLATPYGDGVQNLMRYALGIGRDVSASERFPRLTFGVGGQVAVYRFPFDPGRDDLAYVVEATDDLADWREAVSLFDSRADFPEELEEGWLILRDAELAQRRFYRLRVLLLGGE